MSVDKSLRRKNSLLRARSVLTRGDSGKRSAAIAARRKVTSSACSSSVRSSGGMGAVWHALGAMASLLR